MLITAILLAAAAAPTTSPAPADIDKRAVTMLSDGTFMAGDLYLPKNLTESDKLPAIVLCAGTAGTKGGGQARVAHAFARRGYITLAFDYRGWGESDSRLVPLGPMPKPDSEGKVTVEARAARWQMDFADQAYDIRCAIAFVAGEPNVDRGRIGLWGTSYGGGLVTWVAANDPRVKCVAAQVPGMGGGRPPAATQYALDLQTKQARGETEPVPFETGKLGGKLAQYAQMRANPAKSIGYNAIEAAAKVRVPTIIIDADKEELMDRAQNGQKVADILKTNGVPVAYHVLKDIGHYGVYREAFNRVTELELGWFDEHLKQNAKK